ncbi:MAG: NUDIX domain-containing protein [Proteobacteria bacterium]|nr:MAG: NUDIX domain-containing protein [Pseudomonadota bacterium]
MQKYVLAFLFNTKLNQVLLLKKNRGPEHLIGKWTGLGGKVEAGETPLSAIKREVKEESGLQIEFNHSDHFATLFKNGIFEMHIYTKSISNLDEFQELEDEELGIAFVEFVDYSLLTKNGPWIINMALCKLRGCNDFLIIEES